MKRFIRDLETQRFLKEDGWTIDKAEATSFDSVHDLLKACKQHRIKHLEVIYMWNHNTVEKQITMRV